MVASLFIFRYKAIFIPFAFLAMAVFHVPLLFNRKIFFYKLLGSGKNGSFSKKPDLRQWAIFITWKDETGNYLPVFIEKWLKFFKCEILHIELAPVGSKGKWDGKALFDKLENQWVENVPIAILTRATIRISRLREFWQNVKPVSAELDKAKGLLLSVGIGEMPFIKQATFSIWETMDDMKAFAYTQEEHAAVIQKTRKRNWYSEEMFTRFKIISCKGTLKGKNPLMHNKLPL
ncbi:MAG TPA: spheroidene monooxygenase [Ferruginibacter sp.]|nr:spheroidene monooxygenase [Ferruginibacter sp.]